MRLSVSLFVLTASLCVTAPAATLFDNGAPDDTNFLDCVGCRSAEGVRVFDNFSVTGAPWNVTGMFATWTTLSQNNPQFLPLSAHWEIRQGIATGNSGTLIAQGDAPLNLQQVPSMSSSYFFRGEIAIPNLLLAPGAYWMSLAPNFRGIETYLIGTTGANGVNAIHDGDSYVIGTYWAQMTRVGDYLQPFTNRSDYDFAYGLTGTAGVSGVPEPSSFALILAGLPTGYVLLRRSRR